MGDDYLDSYGDSYSDRDRYGYNGIRNIRPSAQPILKPKPEVKAVYKISHEIDSSEVELLPAQSFETMMRNSVRASDEFTDEDINWCRDNCTDIWSYNDVDLIRFLSKEDMTLFMVARS